VPLQITLHARVKEAFNFFDLALGLVRWCMDQYEDIASEIYVGGM